jgi:hypothetical protein
VASEGDFELQIEFINIQLFLRKHKENGIKIPATASSSDYESLL